jgi:hypothetical protein
MFVNLEKGGFHIYVGTSCGWLYADEGRGKEGRRQHTGLEQYEDSFLASWLIGVSALCDARGSQEKLEAKYLTAHRQRTQPKDCDDGQQQWQ